MYVFHNNVCLCFLAGKINKYQAFCRELTDWKSKYIFKPFALLRNINGISINELKFGEILME